jgi:hypothetical protein
MQQLRYLCITAQEDGTVNYAEAGWGKDGDKGPLVLPLPLYKALAITDVIEIFVALGGRYWLDSYAALCDVHLGGRPTFEALWEQVMELNEAHRYRQSSPALPFDQERF